MKRSAIKAGGIVESLLSRRRQSKLRFHAKKIDRLYLIYMLEFCGLLGVLISKAIRL